MPIIVPPLMKVTNPSEVLLESFTIDGEAEVVLRRYWESDPSKMLRVTDLTSEELEVAKPYIIHESSWIWPLSRVMYALERSA